MADLAHAMWTHGTSMQFEYPDRLAKLRRLGWGVDLEGSPGSANWFHFAIPTPVIVSGDRLRLGSVLVDFETGSIDAFVKHVHVWDGKQRISQHNDVNLSERVGMRRFEIPEKPRVREGIGVSIGVGFGVEPMSHQMKFFSAGGDFLL